MTKVFKVELLIIDHNDIGEDEIKSAIEDTNYPADCIWPNVMAITSRDINYSDEHPLNNRNTMLEEYNCLFKKKLP